MNSHAANAAAAGRVSLGARLAPGAMTNAYGCGFSLCGSGESRTPLPRLPLSHELGHLLGGRGLAPGNGIVSLAYPCHGGLIR